MLLAEKVAALMHHLRPADLDSLPPAERRRFADLCRHWADLAERPPAKAGVLADLRQGLREG